jgi:DNA invertase Pin-like site-specific DNA recombinase
MKFVAYYRVSTQKQGVSGLGLDAQKKAVADYVAGKGKVVAEFEEIESGRRSDRPKLDEALAECRLRQAILIVAKLDRLTRNTEFLLKLKNDQANIVFCDLPTIPPGCMGKFFITQMVAVAELEAGLISQRTKAALACVKAKGDKKLGNPQNLRNADKGRDASRVVRKANADQRAAEFKPFIMKLRAKGITSFKAIARELTAQEIVTSRNKATWAPMQVSRLLKRIEEVAS